MTNQTFDPATAARPLALAMTAPVGMLAAEAAPSTDVAAETAAPVLKRFAMSAYTGGAMTLRGWRNPTVIDLSGLAWSSKPRPILKDHNPSLIVGHTDSTGSDAINNPLSVNRASSTRDYLASRGVTPNRIGVNGQGSRQPVADNGSDMGRAKNRRVEIFVAEAAPAGTP